MSAFLVNKKHIDALLTWARRNRYHHEMACYYWPEYSSECRVFFYEHLDEIGQKLWGENTRSVNERYDEQTPSVEYHFTAYPLPLSAVQIIKACDCWRYQSCETDDHKETEAWAIIESIRERAIDELPGYDDAMWEIN